MNKHLNRRFIPSHLGIQEATPFETVLISVYEPETGLLRRVTGVGMSQETLEQLKSHQQPWKSVMQLLKPEFKFSEAYFIPFDETPVIPTDVHLVTIMPPSEGQLSPNSWNPDDFLLFPLNDMKGNPLGLVSLDAPRDGLRPDLHDHRDPGSVCRPGRVDHLQHLPRERTSRPGGFALPTR